MHHSLEVGLVIAWFNFYSTAKFLLLFISCRANAKGRLMHLSIQPIKRLSKNKDDKRHKADQGLTKSWLLQLTSTRI